MQVQVKWHEDKRLLKIALKYTQDRGWIKRGWHKDNMSWLNYWGIDKSATLQNINNIPNIITSMFKKKMWGENDLEVKRKLRYYKEVINPNLEDQNDLSILTSLKKKKKNITNIRMNSHEIHSEMGRLTLPKTPWVERIFHLCENMSVEDENHFLLECPAYTHTILQFHNLLYNTILLNLLIC